VDSSQIVNQLAYEVVKTCRLCGSSDLVSSLRLRDTAFGDRYLQPGKGAANANLMPLEIVQCMSCNGFQTSVVVDTEGMYEHYLSRPGAVNKILSSAYRQYAEHLNSLLDLTSKDLVVEIGSNDGLFASIYAEKEVRCLGVDPAQNLSQVALERGVKTISTFFGSSVANDIVAENGNAKLIVANFMVANVSDLDDFMIGVKTLLASDGIYAMETNYVLDVVDNMQLEVINHEHITYFSVVSLSTFLEKHGLEIFRAQRVPSKSGSLRCYIQHKGSNFEIESSVADAKRCEIDYGVFLPSVWKPMEYVIDHVRAAAGRYFETKTSEGIVGYGSSIGATTLIYSLEIGQYLKALIDDDPYRQGLESPGFAIPTVSKDDIFADEIKAKYCVVLAPRYVTQIMENNKSAVDGGVRFARVWPMLEEVPYHSWHGESSMKAFEK
jgi:cyclopropane fatty-acyl-phospholipid synthase-like methyltransferase